MNRRKDEESPRTTTAGRQDLLQSYTMQAEDSLGSQVKRRNNTVSECRRRTQSLSQSLSFCLSSIGLSRVCASAAELNEMDVMRQRAEGNTPPSNQPP